MEQKEEGEEERGEEGVVAMVELLEGVEERGGKE